MQLMTPQQAKAAMDSGDAVIIDVREPDELAQAAFVGQAQGLGLQARKRHFVAQGEQQERARWEARQVQGQGALARVLEFDRQDAADATRARLHHDHPVA